jgi:hypothetical protein
MGIRLRTLLVGALASFVAIAGTASTATALSNSGDVQLAKAGLVQTSDFPTGFKDTAPDNSSDAAVAKAAQGVPECAAYSKLQKLTHAQPQAKSPDFDDASRSVSNKVDMFKSTAAASAALKLYGNASVPVCLDKLFTKLLTQQFAKQKSTTGKVKGVKVTIEQQPITGLGDDSVIYEGNALVTLKDGTTQQLGLGNAAVQVGRAVSDFTYTTTDADLTEILQPAIESSVARLQTALTTS